MTTDRLHTELEARVYGRTDRPPEHGVERQVRAGPEVVAAPTVGELEELWGHHRDEWPLLGPSADRAETLAVVRRPDDRRRTLRYTLEREHPAGGTYVALETLDTEGGRGGAGAGRAARARDGGTTAGGGGGGRDGGGEGEGPDGGVA